MTGPFGDVPSDDESYNSDVGIIDGTRPRPNKVDILNQLRAPRWKSRKKQTDLDVENEANEESLEYGINEDAD